MSLDEWVLVLLLFSLLRWPNSRTAPSDLLQYSCLCIILFTSVKIRPVTCFYSIEYGKGDVASMTSLCKSVTFIFLEDFLLNEASDHILGHVQGTKDGFWQTITQGLNPASKQVRELGRGSFPH